MPSWGKFKISSLDHFSLIAPIYSRVTYSKTAILADLARLPVDGTLLDVGGGTGRVSAAVRDLVREAVISDVSFGMLREATRATLRPVCGGSEALPFADGSFERVIMVDALHHVLNHAETASEMFRVVKPGGLLVIEEPDIRTFGVKLIALAEKLLLMRSHFLSPDEIINLFDGSGTAVTTEDGTAWVVIEKQAAAKP